jgi:hypothetical protein
MAYKIISIIIIALILSGCDSFQKALFNQNKGTVDAVYSCIEENSHKVGLLTENEIEQACIEKHQLYSKGSFTTKCSAWVTIVPDGISRIEPSDKCFNETNHIITKIEGFISVRNLNTSKENNSIKHTETAYGKTNATSIKPNETLHWNIIRFEKDWSDQVTENLPYCSQKPDETCKSWGFTGYHYLKINI